MRPIGFCDRCRGMEVGWNRKYLTHLLVCASRPTLTQRLVAYVALSILFISLFPKPTTHEASRARSSVGASSAEAEPSGQIAPDPMVASIEDLVGRHASVDAADRIRIARAVVDSARKHDVDPFLVASILLVESSGDPFAISERDAVGLMQIHVPTWGSIVDEEQISLFRIEDNIDLGTQILRDYTRRHGLWDGVLRYLGTSGPSPQGDAYLRRVQGIYSDRMAD